MAEKKKTKRLKLQKEKFSASERKNRFLARALWERVYQARRAKSETPGDQPGRPLVRT